RQYTVVEAAEWSSRLFEDAEGGRAIRGIGDNPELARATLTGALDPVPASNRRNEERRIALVVRLQDPDELGVGERHEIVSLNWEIPVGQSRMTNPFVHRRIPDHELCPFALVGVDEQLEQGLL